MEIADILGYSVEFIPKKGKFYLPTEEKEKEMAESIEKSNEGMVRIPSQNFGETIICGSNAQAAAEHLMQQPYLSKSAEIMLHQKIKKRL